MKNLLLISSKVPHYRVSVYNYMVDRFQEHGWAFQVASNDIHREGRKSARFHFHEVPFRFSEYRRLIDQIGPAAVMFHLHLKEPIFWLLMHWLKRRGTPVVNWTKGANLDRPNSRWRFYAFNCFHLLSDAIILYSSEQMGCVARRFHKKVFVANNAVNFADYPTLDQSKEEIKAEFNIPFKKVVLFAGTMGIDGERKKVDHIIEVFRRLDRKDVGLVLVGSGLSEERRARLNPANTLYLGEVHDPRNERISKLFKAADVFAIPGHAGLALNQAFFWGVPVVTEAGLHPPEIQYLKNNRNGYMVPENDLGQLSEKIMYLLDNPDVHSEFSRNAKRDIHEDASIEKMFQSFWGALQFATLNGKAA